MIKINTYLSTGRKTTDTTLPKSFEEKENDILLAQAIHIYRAKSHRGVSRTKTRGEVDLTKRKMYSQKGTGNARHGAQSAPIFVGGGKAHGPTGIKKQLVMPKKMRKKALSIAISMKAKDKKMVAASGLSSIKKTKQAQAMLDKISKHEKRFTVILSDKNMQAKRYFRNIDNVQVLPFKSINAYKVYLGGYLVVDKEALVK